MGNYSNCDDEQTLDLVDLFRELINKIHIILLVVVIGALLGIILPKVFIVPKYTSSGTLMAESGLIREDIIEMIQSSVVAEDAAARIHDSIGESISVEVIEEDISVTYPDSSNIITISVTDSDPYVAFDIADKVVEASAEFINESLGTDAVSILEKRTIPNISNAVSIKKSIALGGIVGFIISFVFITALYMTNKKIRSIEDIEKYLGLNILGIMPMYKKNHFCEKKLSNEKEVGKEGV